MKNYDAVVTRDGRWWMIEIPEMDGLTQARRLDDVEKMAREYIAVTLDIPMSQVDVSVSGIEVAGQDLLEAKALVEDLRRHSQQVEALVADLTRQFASALTSASVPVRDVSKVLGISHQRVSQLVQSAAAVPASTLARLIARAKAEHGSDIVAHRKPVHRPEAGQLRTPKQATASRTPRPKRVRGPAPIHGGSSHRRAAATTAEGRTRRPSIAGRAGVKKAEAKRS
ncbi:hypothetical protein [Kribbella endophytica]